MKGKGIILLLSAILCLTACGTIERKADGVVSTTESESDNDAGAIIMETETEEAVSDTIPDDTFTETSMPYTPWEGDVDANFIGVWHRTNCHSAIAGTIAMDKIEKETHGGIKGTFIHFKGEFIRGGNLGNIEGEALFINENEAVYTSWEALEDPNLEYDTYLIFNIDDSGLHVSLQGENDRLGFGQGVSATGDYITDEPVYTNTNIVEETFSEEELGRIKELLGEQIYNDEFIYVTSGGVVFDETVILADEKEARYIEAFIPGVGIGYDMLITEDGRIYYKPTGAEKDGFAVITDDPEYEGTQLPEYTDIPEQ